MSVEIRSYDPQRLSETSYEGINKVNRFYYLNTRSFNSIRNIEHRRNGTLQPSNINPNFSIFQPFNFSIRNIEAMEPYRFPTLKPKSSNSSFLKRENQQSVLAHCAKVSPNPIKFGMGLGSFQSGKRVHFGIQLPAKEG